MRNRMLRSVLVAAFSAVVALGVLSGFSDAKDGHNKMIESLPRIDLAGEQLRRLHAKMKYLRESLDRLRNISCDRGEAA